MTFAHLYRVIYRRFLLLKDIQQYGFLPTLKRLAQLREAWAEKGNKVLVGQDRYGNTYWTTTEGTEVREYFLGVHMEANIVLQIGDGNIFQSYRNRWVELKGRSSQWMYDASAIPSEWHGWLHYSRDNPPTPEEQAGQTLLTPQRLKVTHEPMQSGSRDQYFTPHHIFNAVHTNPIQKPFASYKRPTPQDYVRANHNHYARDYQKVPLDELNEERPRYH